MLDHFVDVDDIEPLKEIFRGYGYIILDEEEYKSLSEGR